MQTKDPALTKTLITDPNHLHDDHHVTDTHHDILSDDHKGTETMQETVIGTRYASDDMSHSDVNNEVHHAHEMSGQHHSGVQTATHLSNTDAMNPDYDKGTETFQESVVHTEHVNEGDDPARQPDRRDQQGNPFDEGVNEYNVRDDAPKSEGINDMNRYASLDNAQSRILNPDEK